MKILKHKIFNPIVLLAAIALMPITAHADSKTFETFGDYKVIYTVFNSSFLQPEVAAAYNLTRGKREALVNVALIKSDNNGDSQGLPAKINGIAANLMQQQKTLNFIEIQEQNAVYYLAPLHINNEEVLNFSIDVSPDSGGGPFTLKFSKKLYIDK